MTVLADRDLMRLYPGATGIQPSSIDLHLGNELKTLRGGIVLDPEADQSDEWISVGLGTYGAGAGRWRLRRGQAYLGVTAEPISISPDHVGLLHGVSSLGRLFLLIHVTAGLVDPGWTNGRLTLELMSLGSDIYLRPGQRIGQVTIHELTSACLHPYDGKYAGDQGAVPSRMFRESPIGTAPPACAGLSGSKGDAQARFSVGRTG